MGNSFLQNASKKWTDCVLEIVRSAEKSLKQRKLFKKALIF